MGKLVVRNLPVIAQNMVKRCTRTPLRSSANYEGKVSVKRDLVRNGFSRLFP